MIAVRIGRFSTTSDTCSPIYTRLYTKHSAQRYGLSSLRKSTLSLALPLVYIDGIDGDVSLPFRQRVSHGDLCRDVIANVVIVGPHIDLCIVVPFGVETCHFATRLIKLFFSLAWTVLDGVRGKTVPESINDMIVHVGDQGHDPLCKHSNCI
jgi:hypothetical protein